MSIRDTDLADSLRRLASSQDPGQDVSIALQAVVDACVDLFGVAGSGLMIGDEQDMLRYVAASDDQGRILEQSEIDTGQGPCTEAYVTGQVITSSDVRVEEVRWPDLAAALAPYPIRAVLGTPVKLGGVPVGTLDLYREEPYDWDDSERAALDRYGEVVGTTLTAALRAHTAGELADQLQYALDYRVVIERAVGYLMASRQTDAVTAFNVLRSAARSRRTKIGEVAEHLLANGRLPD